MTDEQYKAIQRQLNELWSIALLAIILLIVIGLFLASGIDKLLVQ